MMLLAGSCGLGGPAPATGRGNKSLLSGSVLRNLRGGVAFFVRAGEADGGQGTELSMLALDTLKKGIEQMTDIGMRSSASVRRFIRRRKARTAWLRDDGLIPNNSQLPLIYYRNPVHLAPSLDPAAVFEQLFESNGWTDSWRDSIYDYAHYHSATHEVLGIARGSARVRFGGSLGKLIELRAGDVAVLPAGTGHQRVFGSDDLLVVGAYPGGGHYDECRGSHKQHERSRASIPQVPLPDKDPVYGAEGPLRDLWR